MMNAIALSPLDSNFTGSWTETTLAKTLMAHSFPSAHNLGQTIAPLLASVVEPLVEDLQVDLQVGDPSQIVDYEYGAYTWIVGQAGDDTLTGTVNRDLISGLGGNDWLNGGAGDDRLTGGVGNDTLIGGAGDNYPPPPLSPPSLRRPRRPPRLPAGAGNDQLNGGAGQDDLRGGSGDDVLIDGDVGDRFTGGSGSDEFRIGNGRLPDGPKITIFPPAPDFIVTDFTVDEDVLTLNFGITFDDLTFLDTENGVIISSQRREGLVLLQGVEAADLTEEQFRFSDPE